jgi:hypothetical protein
MLAEAFDEEVKAFCQSDKLVSEFSFMRDLTRLYEKFLNRKYTYIRIKEKLNLDVRKDGADEARNDLVKPIARKHHIQALAMLLGVEFLQLLHIDSQYTSIDEDVTRTGIAEIGNEGKRNFIHRSFAEYYVATYFVNEFTNESNISDPFTDYYLFASILMEEDYRVVRTFIDGLLMSEPSNKVKKTVWKSDTWLM